MQSLTFHWLHEVPDCYSDFRVMLYVPVCVWRTGRIGMRRSMGGSQVIWSRRVYNVDSVIFSLLVNGSWTESNRNFFRVAPQCLPTITAWRQASSIARLATPLFSHVKINFDSPVHDYLTVGDAELNTQPGSVHILRDLRESKIQYLSVPARNEEKN